VYSASPVVHEPVGPGACPPLTFADQRARAGPEADECFARPAVADLTMPMATEESSARWLVARPLRHEGCEHER
jgi:hypothetical protein